jgi:hypothetical protein
VGSGDGETGPASTLDPVAYSRWIVGDQVGDEVHPQSCLDLTGGPFLQQQ